MSTPASVKGHPIHPMMVALPIGLWVFSFACQIIALFAHDSIWLTVALYSAGGGVLGALGAALPGFIDLLAIDDDHVRSYGIKHMTANLIAVCVWAVSFWFLLPSKLNQTVALGASVVGMLLIGYSGWLGGEMVYRHGVGVKSAGENVPPRQQPTRRP